MIEKLKDFIITTIDNTGRMKVRGAPRFLVISWIFLIWFTVVLYISGWLYVFYTVGRIDFRALIELLQVITGVAFVSAIGFLIKAMIDDDGDGVPDYLQKGDEDVKRDSVSAKHTNDVRDGRKL